ncbi:aminotransferase class IV [Stanieria cyanosphaera PCC 7437]|uniref:Aminotransferase class IV n=1 Tax=Stanieria cyanosphaera (strain ATCC 29371 / PCC 7437) TaxID=111780 RepID=K9Y0C0_STAC7|nr:aminotransferase class IV [Stanieria cyanosphaera]AFZ37836.1 aminotransferase class IV [Stanieria cyanosphaera PCC 7437]
MYWYDGNFIEHETLQISINEPGLLYGATVFTTMRVYEQSLDHPLTHWQAHCDRLCQSIQAFNWQQPDWQRLKQGAELLLTHYPILRIAILPDGRELITGRNLPVDLLARQQQGITAWVAEDNLFRRDLAAHKTGNYLGSYLALQKAHQLSAKEAILLDSNGNWLETSTGNLWGWCNGCWYTPALSVGILPGIIRSQLLTWLDSQNISVQENIWTPDFVRSLEFIAYTNCVVEIVAITKFIKFQCDCNKSVSVTKIKYLKSYFMRRN